MRSASSYKYCLDSAPGAEGDGAPGKPGSVRFLTLVPLPRRLELPGCREGQLCGHWGGYGLALQSGHLKASLRRQTGSWQRAVSLGGAWAAASAKALKMEGGQAGLAVVLGAKPRPAVQDGAQREDPGSVGRESGLPFSPSRGEEGREADLEVFGMGGLLQGQLDPGPHMEQPGEGQKEATYLMEGWVSQGS